MPEPKPTEIKAAKGRPMLTWVGKKPLRRVTPLPAQKVEVFDPTHDAATRDGDAWGDWPSGYPRAGLLFHGENKDVLAHLLANGFRGKVKLIYIDPPFDSGADYVRKVQLRGVSGTAKVDGEPYTLGEQVQYEDIWANDNYLQFMYERLLLLKEMLSHDGSIYVQMDWRRAHYVKVVMDEVFGPDSYIREIIWRIGWVSGYKSTADNWIRNHETLLFYAKDPSAVTFNKTYVPYPPDYERWGGRPSGKGLPVEDVWGVFPQEGVTSLQVVSYSSQLTDYPTQKPEGLIKRVIAASSDPGDLVVDCFVGSGTTAVVAQKLGRRWIACDINKGALHTAEKRLQEAITDQINNARKAKAVGKLIADEEVSSEIEPAELSFAVYRVNDYDLQVQHNEAVSLACNAVGITRTRADSYFDGTRGRQLAKIIPVSHPLTILDLEGVRKELEARPEEDRGIVVVCLGKELAVNKWLEEWNRLRQRGDVPNTIEIIDIRDPHYGAFEHKPAQARVDTRREKGKIVVEVQDFISPTIIERLRQQAGILEPHIDDWRAMVDTVMIDAAYDGEVFNVCLSDVPEKKADLVQGRYEFPAPGGETTVAVKITDMLGEEVLVTAVV